MQDHDGHNGGHDEHNAVPTSVRRAFLVFVVILPLAEWQDQMIAAIAYEVGFNSLSVFNAAFKKFTGQTPSEFRRSIIW